MVKILKTERRILDEIEAETRHTFRELPERVPTDGSYSRVAVWDQEGATYEIDARGRVIGIGISGRDSSASDVRISTFPSALLKLAHLKNLDLRANNLREIPEELFRKMDVDVSLHWGMDPSITLDRNPLISPPIEIVDQGREAILQYFQSLAGGTQAVREVRIILVGEGGSGKTSLSRRLLGEKFDPAEPQTHGINIRSWQPKASGDPIKGNLWDFGGQEIMHATHQFFLSKRCLYVLVLDGRREERIEYWLRLIQTFGGGSPILIILNKIDQNPSFDINRRFLTEKYSTIESIHRVSCASGDGIEGVQDAILAAASNLETMQMRWPSNWLHVKEELERTGSNYLTYNDYANICDEAHVTPSSQGILLDYLHDLGVVLHFPDFALEDMQVLNPEWVTSGVYSILNSERLATANGYLMLSDVRKILGNSADYPSETRRYLMELMMKFELCYRVADDAVLIPDLLPVQEPALTAGVGIAVHLVLKYEFLPTSVLPRFMVRMYRDVNERWRTGVRLEDSFFGASALVVSDRESSSVQISVFGPQRREYAAVVLATFRAIHRSYDGLRCREYVTMPDDNQVIVSYSHLLKLEQLGTDEYIPDGAERSYSVADLLGAVRPNANSSMDEVLTILRKLQSEHDTEETLAQKANDILLLQPNFYGIGININQLISHLFSGKPQKSSNLGTNGLVHASGSRLSWRFVKKRRPS